MVTFDGVWHLGDVFSSLYRADGRQCVWYRVSGRFADVSTVNGVAHGGSGVMV